MSVLEWKSVGLFELIALPSITLQNINTDITAHCSNATKTVNGTTSTTVLCDKNGYIHVIFENCKKQMPISFKHNNSQQKVKMCALTANNLLATIQEDNDQFSLSIHVYDLKNLTKKNTHPCISSTAVPIKSSATFIEVAVVGSDKVLSLGIGFEKGDILLHFGKFTRDLLLNLRRHIIGTSTITGIQFEDNNQQADIKLYNMFVTCLDGIYCFAINDKGFVESKFVLDNKKNIHSHCCTVSQGVGLESFFVVGQDDAIYCFTRDGRGPCYAIGGEKEYISWIGHHLVVVVKTLIDSVLICVDVENKLIVFHKRIKHLTCITSGENVYHIITKGESFKSNCTYNIYKLQEHNAANKVRLLVAKCMYDSALRILERNAESADYENAAYVRLQFGNNLLMRGSFNRAVVEFEKTIGVIKPYEIISKLLYSRHNDNLRQYLSKLLESQHITSEQKKLLTRCIDRENLSLRIQQIWDSRDDTTHICDFKQLARAINFTSLLNAWNQMEKIILFFQNIDQHEALNLFLEHGSELLLMDSTMLLENVKTLLQNRQIKNILSFLMIFLDKPEFCANLLADLIRQVFDHDEKVHYYLLVLYLGLWRDKKISSQKIHEFLKQTPLKLELILILCKAYFFSLESKYQHSEEQIAHTGHIENTELHIKTNPNLTNLLAIGPQSLLLILSKVCSTQNIQILDLRSLLIEKLMKNLFNAKSELQLIESLKDDIHINGSLISQFKLNPVEFRNSYCGKCRQSLQMPSVYFLCQHSFHKDCLHYNYNATTKKNETVCSLCNEINKYILVSNYAKTSISNKPDDVIEGVSNVFASRILTLNDCEQCANRLYCRGHNSFISNAAEHIKNPFDENFDSNFNCF